MTTPTGLITRERADRAQLKFHQICLNTHCDDESTINGRDAKLVREFLSDCSLLLPTEKQLEGLENDR